MSPPAEARVDVSLALSTPRDEPEGGVPEGGDGFLCLATTGVLLVQEV